MKQIVRFSYLAITAIAFASGCSGASGGDTAGDGDTTRDPSVAARNASPAQREARDLASDVSAQPVAGDGERDDTESGATAQTQSDAEAAQSDLEATAAAQGWTLDEARLYQAKTDAVGDVATQIDSEHPGVLVGSVVGPEPSDAPRVYIKGPADASVQAIVAAAPFDIVVIDRQPFSLIEIDQRQSMLTAELLELGYLNFVVSTDIEREALLEATVERAAGAPDSEDEILAALPEALRAPTRILLVDDVGGSRE